MEKIVIGVPYEISIEASIDIGKFDAELVINKDDFQVGVNLKKVKGKDIDYSFIIPTKLKTLLKKSDVGYSIFVYKENARFEVDDGKLKFIDEYLDNGNSNHQDIQDNVLLLLQIYNS